jgi:hypothetical protein
MSEIEGVGSLSSSDFVPFIDAGILIAAEDTSTTRFIHMVGL